MGSSPLTRGKHNRARRAGVEVGLIPAHAGKTRGTGASRPGAGAHPRSRGENSMLKDRLRYEDGSSPLTRGKQAGGLPPLGAVGLIPAHAGKTLGRHQDLDQQRAHPRSRGENGFPQYRSVPGTGSSPLTRGKHTPFRVLAIEERLIPAHAGKTSSTGSHAAPPWAHPRSRGEN